MMIAKLIVFGIIAYLLGSLSCAIITAKIMGLADPRTQGSGNPGATNILRISGKKLAILVLLGDCLKGLIPVLLAKVFGLEGAPLAMVGVCAFIGHLYPVFFQFKGGKGVATSLGVLIALSPWAALFAIITWLIIAYIFRYSSLAAIMTACMAPVYILFFHFDYFIPVLAMALLLIWRHRDNIKRLRAGEESKLKMRPAKKTSAKSKTTL